MASYKDSVNTTKQSRKEQNQEQKHNSIRFNGYLLTCRLNSTSGNYKASTKTQIKYKNSTNTQKQNTQQTKQNIDKLI
jgi:hypothetical protein